MTGRNGSAPATAKSDAKLATARQKHAEALRLRCEGKTYGQIADALGYKNRSSVSAAIGAELDRIPAAGVDLLRRIESARLDALTAAIWTRAMAGDTRSVRAAVLISKRRASLLGLDVPKADGSVTVAVAANITTHDVKIFYAEPAKETTAPPA